VFEEEVTVSASTADSLTLDALSGVFSAIMSRPASDEYWLGSMLCSAVFASTRKASTIEDKLG
jgi:hypothetical protein